LGLINISNGLKLNLIKDSKRQSEDDAQWIGSRILMEKMMGAIQ
jgi:hypothetical protein